MFQTLQEALQHIAQLEAQRVENNEERGRLVAENAKLRERLVTLDEQNYRFAERLDMVQRCNTLLIAQNTEMGHALDGAMYHMQSFGAIAEELGAEHKQLRAENQQLRADVRELHGANQLLMDSNGELRHTVRELQTRVAELDKSNKHLAGASRALREVAQRALRESEAANP